MEIKENDYSHIKAWGIDADDRNEPTYPMKNYTGADHERLNWERPDQQEVSVEILHSNERPSVSSVFGTSSPPSGLSGTIRRYAFKHSENEYLHWLPLLFADRVNMIEGIIEDLRGGYFPNILAERGWAAEWKFNKKEVVKNALTTAAIAGAILYFSLKNNKPKRIKKA